MLLHSMLRISRARLPLKVVLQALQSRTIDHSEVASELTTAQLAQATGAGHEAP